MSTKRFSLTFAILAALSCLLILTWLLISLISFKTAEKDLLAQKSDAGRLLLAAFVHLLPDNFHVLGRAGSAERFIGRIARDKSYLGVYVVDARGQRIYSHGSVSAPDDRLLQTLVTGTESAVLRHEELLLVRYAPVYSKGSIVGAARLTLSLEPEYIRLTKTRHLFLAYCFLDFILLLVFGSYVLERSIVRPIRRLLGGTARITAGDLSCRVPVPGSSEIAELAEAFNHMVEALRLKRAEVESHIASLERINRDLLQAREETLRSEKMASVGLLAAGTAHEIGTPLAAIIGYAGILGDELSGNEEHRDYLQRIEAEAGRIDRIIRSLLEYSRPAQAQQEQLHLAGVVQETLELLEKQGVFKSLQVCFAADTDDDLLKGDRQELQQVFINLFINARDAMPDGGSLHVRVFHRESLDLDTSSLSEISVRGRRRTDFGGIFHSDLEPSGGREYLCVDVSDSGMGIAPENLERIFDPFFTTKEPGRGTGLGLAVTARIIDGLGGRITVDSMPAQGTKFTVWLPRGTNHS